VRAAQPMIDTRKIDQVSKGNKIVTVAREQYDRTPNDDR
jgi:hypothetical protein